MEAEYSFSVDEHNKTRHFTAWHSLQFFYDVCMYTRSSRSFDMLFNLCDSTKLINRGKCH